MFKEEVRPRPYQDSTGARLLRHLLTETIPVYPGTQTSCVESNVLTQQMHTKCHATCSKTNLNERSVGRPMEEREFNYFEQSDECQYSIQELQDIMSGISGKKETYSDKHLKNILLEHFKECIMVSNVSSTKNVMCLSDTAHKIIDSWFKDKDNYLETEKLRIILAAADIIKEDIQKMVYDHNTIPRYK
ncbi:hypothetical protein PR048_001926 [Dryococelus australis]|uniref:Uncharacterized protein n=1 Tax=Dryococelus australis TaxID=614101 RepID=A0ABQ9IIQ1_9NEOP|nr:hypothetical protein PR048_001926 [Dryococelus australis]